MLRTPCLSTISELAIRRLVLSSEVKFLNNKSLISASFVKPGCLNNPPFIPMFRQPGLSPYYLLCGWWGHSVEIKDFIKLFRNN